MASCAHILHPRESISYGLTPMDMKDTVGAYPVLTYDDRMTINPGGQVIELIHARHSHTEGDTLVYLPGSRLIF